MGVGRNINTLLRRATKKAGMPRLEHSWCVCGVLHVVVAGASHVCVCVRLCSEAHAVPQMPPTFTVLCPALADFSGCSRAAAGPFLS